MKFILTLTLSLFLSASFYAQTEMYLTDKIIKDSSALMVRKTFKSVKINKRTWMIENLNVVSYRNGDTIPEAKSERDWKKCMQEQKGCWCYFQNDTLNGEKFGKLYNWFAVNDPRGLAPEGWHVATDEEWTSMINSQGGKLDAAPHLKAEFEWCDNCLEDNKSGFFALPGGFRKADGSFMHLKEFATFWTSTVYKDNMAYYYYMYCNVDYVVRNFWNKGDGMSVRCIKD
jgi:uncharacterized protein (TIGR02145 family)